MSLRHNMYTYRSLAACTLRLGGSFTHWMILIVSCDFLTAAETRVFILTGPTYFNYGKWTNTCNCHVSHVYDRFQFSKILIVCGNFQIFHGELQKNSTKVIKRSRNSNTLPSTYKVQYFSLNYRFLSWVRVRMISLTSYVYTTTKGELTRSTA
jgi:hypothetical protein